MKEKELEDIIAGKELANVLQLSGTLLQNLELSETKTGKQLNWGYQGKLWWMAGAKRNL